MARCVDKVELVGFTIFRRVRQGNTLRFNSNTALALNIHGIENLSGHFTLGQASTNLNKAVCDGRFAMVNMGNNRKVSDVTEIGQGVFTTIKKCERSLAYL